MDMSKIAKIGDLLVLCVSMGFLFSCLTLKRIVSVQDKKKQGIVRPACMLAFFPFQPCSFGFHSKGLVLEACRYLKIKLVSANVHPLPVSCTQHLSRPHDSVPVGRWRNWCGCFDCCDQGPQATGSIYTSSPLCSEMGDANMRWGMQTHLWVGCQLPKSSAVRTIL